MEGHERIEDYHVPGCKCVPCIKERAGWERKNSQMRQRDIEARALCKIILHTSVDGAKETWFDLQVRAHKILKSYEG